MEIILAFLLKRLFFQSITSCQVACSALTAKKTVRLPAFASSKRGSSSFF
jgi:hypothetical protein